MGRVSDPAQADAWTRLQVAVMEAVVLITPKELAARLDINGSYLHEALHGKNNKGFRLEWLPAVILMAPIDSVAAILRALADLRGFDVSKRKQLTLEELREAEREWLQRMAPGLLVTMDREIGR